MFHSTQFEVVYGRPTSSLLLHREGATQTEAADTISPTSANTISRLSNKRSITMTTGTAMLSLW